ncbi:Alpha-N-acetylgalactosaminidase [Drechslerella dactyloides]|uniref:Alpha-N-acetylgalactosaminidase n=1 Tax=Drechslerella dactyloides TaxID=74499 RepID=A0AAD6J432_DREDA|nr:Alpha-N-acetylgalactosaminidase [Drechslerella dactyloides]
MTHLINYNPHLMATVNVGLVGYGLSTTAFQIPTITVVDNAKVYAVVQRSAPPDPASNPKRGSHVTVDYPDVKHYRDTDSLFKDPDVHLVIISTPSPGHYDLARAALEHGKHVVVEKPFCPTTKECTELITLAASKSLLLTVYQNRRFDSDFLTLKKYLNTTPSSKLLHPTISVTSQFNRYRLPDSTAGSAQKAWKTENVPGNGILYDLGSHLIDQVLNLFGLPDWLWAHTDNQRQTQPLAVDDSFSVYMYYAAGSEAGKRNGNCPITVELKSSMVSAVPRQNRWVVKGWWGSYKKFGMDVQEEQLRANGVSAIHREDYGAEDVLEWPEITIPDGEAEDDHLEAVFGKVATLKKAGGFINGKVKPEKGDYVEYYRNVIGCVSRVLGGEDASTVKKDLHVKPEEARDVIGVIELAKESSTTGNRVEVRERLKF